MDAQTITAICSVFIAVAALFIAVWQARATRVHNRLSVKPQLVFERKVDNLPPVAQIILKNNGIGPAIVRAFDVQVDGNKIQPFDASKWETIVNEIGIQYKHFNGQNLECGTIIGIGDINQILNVDTSGSQPVRDVFDALFRINIIIEYESIYGKKFDLVLNSDL